MLRLDDPDDWVLGGAPTRSQLADRSHSLDIFLRRDYGAVLARILLKVSTWPHCAKCSLPGHSWTLVFEILLNDKGCRLLNCVITSQVILVLLGEVHSVHYLVCLLRREGMKQSLVRSNHCLSLNNEGIIITNRGTEFISRASVYLKISSEKFLDSTKLSSIIVMIAKDDMLGEGSVSLVLLHGDWIRRQVELEGLGLIVAECPEVDHLLLGGSHV